jgi:hypothetical protein
MAQTKPVLRKSYSRVFLPVVVIPVVLWGVAQIGRSNEIDKSRTSYLWGCYGVDGKEAFKLSRDAAFNAAGQNFGFKVVALKNTDALEFDGGVEIRVSNGEPSLVRPGTNFQYVPIDRTEPVRLTFVSGDTSVQAAKLHCD